MRKANAAANPNTPAATNRIRNEMPLSISRPAKNVARNIIVCAQTRT
jgi:hypothetical protein